MLYVRVNVCIFVSVITYWVKVYNLSYFTEVMKVQANVGTDGARQSTAEAYLKPVKDRKNLHVLPGAHVTKVRSSNNFHITVI